MASIEIPSPMLDILSDIAVDDPDFIYRYAIPVLSSPNAYSQVLSDFTDAMMWIQLEEAGLGSYENLGNLGKSLLKKIGKAIKKVALAPIKIREKVAHAIVGAVKGNNKTKAAPAPEAAPPSQTSALTSTSDTSTSGSVAYSGPSTFQPPSSPASSGGGGGGGGGGGDAYQGDASTGSVTPAGRAPAGQQIATASMFDSSMLPVLAAGAALALIFGKPTSGGRRAKRNPGRRRRRAA